VGAVCGSSARTDLCGGRSVTGVPTAIRRRLVSDRVLVSDVIRRRLFSPSSSASLLPHSVQPCNPIAAAFLTSAAQVE
jgi:hypothetical protein